MAPTTRSRGSALASGLSNDTSKDVELDGTAPTRSTKPAANTTKKEKVYRKAAPEPKQQTFPAKAKTVRHQKSNSNKRLSLPNPTTSSSRRGKRKVDAGDDRKQKTLTQIGWVPSTFPSDDEDWYAEDEEVNGMRFNIFDGDDGVDASGSASGSKKKIKPVKKKAAVSKASTNRGRKRRKTTGDLELELERGDDEEDVEEVSSSRYHTQTLTQMPSWKGLSDMVGDSDEDAGFDFEEDLPGVDGEKEEEGIGRTPPSKKRKRATAPDFAENPRGQPSAPNLTAPPDDPPPAAPESTNPSVVPETPHHPRFERTEIPSSQPSPFTPNVATPNVSLMLNRYVSPLNHDANNRSPLKDRSTNVDAPAPTPSAIRKRTRSEIPDSWSTVNGGMPSSVAGSGVKRTPLKEMHFADYSIELGEGSDRPSQRVPDGVIMDSDDDFEGLSEDEENEAPGTPTPAARPSEKPHETPAIEGSGASHTAMTETATTETLCEEVSAEVAASSKGEEVVASTPADEVAVEDVASGTPRHADNGGIEEVEAEVVSTPMSASSARENAARASRSGSPLISDRAPSAEVTGTPMLSVPKTPTQQPSSQATMQRKAASEPPADENDNSEVETSSHPRRRPSTSSAADKETPFSSPHKTSPTMPPVSQLAYTQFGYTQLGYKSQAFESQRVPFEVIRQWAPQTDRSDVIVSVNSGEMEDIVEGRYSHLFRDFRIPHVVQRIWLYTTAPAKQLKYMASTSGFKLPEDVEPHHKGLGMAEFREGSSTKYAYELLQVYQLNNPVSLNRMREEGWVEQTPSVARFTYVPPAPLGALLGNLRCALFEEPSDESQEATTKSQGVTTESQEVDQQLRSDIEQSTQKVRREPASSPPALSRRRHNEEDVVIPSSQDVALAADDLIRATPVRTKFTSTKQVVFAKPKVPAPPSSRTRQHTEEIDDDDNDSPFGGAGRSLYPSQQQIVKSTVRPSQATTVSAPPSQSQRVTDAAASRNVEYYTIEDSQSPVRSSASGSGEGDGRNVMMIDDSPIPLVRTSSGPQHPTQSSLGLTALLASSQGAGLARMGGEDDSLMDDSRIKMPPRLEEIGGWVEEEEEEDDEEI